jgi:hypothetical protein
MKFSPGCNCCACDAILIVTGCGGTALAGRAITLSQGGDTKGTCTTADGTGGTTLGRCTVTLPSGSYDVSIPASDNYAAFTGSLSHSCPSAGPTTFNLAADSTHACGPSCHCSPVPTTIFVSGQNVAGTFTDTGLWNTPPAGWPGTSTGGGWFLQNPHPVSGVDVYYRVQCSTNTTTSGTVGGLVVLSKPVGGGAETRYWFLPDDHATCSPFHYPLGFQTPGGPVATSTAWDITG